MSFETMLKILLEEMKIPEGQNWVDVAEIKTMAEKLDGDKK